MGKKDYSREKRHLVYPGWQLTPDDFLHFVQGDEFVEAWSELGLDDDDLRAVEVAIMTDPEGPQEILNTDGLRIVTLTAMKDGQREPGVCVGYAYFPDCTVLLMGATDESDDTELTPQECSAMRSEFVKIRKFLAKESANKEEKKGEADGQSNA